MPAGLDSGARGPPLTLLIWPFSGCRERGRQKQRQRERERRGAEGGRERDGKRGRQIDRERKISLPFLRKPAILPD